MILLIILFLTFLFYKETLFYYFISDDFLSFVKYRHFFDLFKINPDNNHYTPVVGIFNYFLNQIFHSNPFFYHLFSLSIHLINICLVYWLTSLFIKDKVKSLIASLIFAFFFANYEVVYWYGANNNSLLVTFYILSLIFLMKFVQTKKTVYSCIFQTAAVIAILTHEYAVSLIPVGLIYWFLFAKEKNLRKLIKIFLFPSIIFLSITVLKFFLVKIPLLVRTPSLFKSIAFILRSFVYLFIPNPYLIDKVPNFFIPIIFLVILVFLFKLTKNKRTLFLLIWATLTIFVYSITSAPQARYFYLSSIPVIIYILSVASVEGKGVNLYLLFIFISGLIFLQNQKYYWQLSSVITKNVIRDVKKYYPSPQKTDVLYFVNLPDSSNDSIWKAYVFRAGFKEFLNNFVNIYPKKIVFLRSFTPTHHTMEASYIKPEKLIKLKQKNIVFIYEERLKSIKKL
ncbi:MAG: glycosyltransferase family 39 protein [Candidatus Roizmanbacteria bacterium]